MATTIAQMELNLLGELCEEAPAAEIDEMAQLIESWLALSSRLPPVLWHQHSFTMPAGRRSFHWTAARKQALLMPFPKPGASPGLWR